ncbi:hypothetical protein MLD38_026628 [Melastoma candidum]|uniref:Uncharacterized protein n=1 Tax=Melastoma candidum TaxID=119954 RepID=A0ACB9P0R6_9MYRT|nr:hypothetical protein MLD38_026628 [Melastoma candidum]
MEAAEALAGLASAAGGSDGGGRGRSIADLCQEFATAGEDISKVSVKIEQGSVFPDDRNQTCRTPYSSSSGGRLRHNSSEVEKEAKRIRRVMANRESARRTIRQRQALSEDLTRRAAELTEENQRLKKGKEIALKEYKSLEATNKHLKAKLKMVEEIKPDLQIGSAVLKPSVSDASASSTNLVMLLYSPPLGQLFWPSIIHSSAHENCQEGRADTILVSPSIVMPGFRRSDIAREQEKLSNMAGHGSPVYIIPCPWFISLNDSGDGCSSSTCGNRRNLNEVSLGNQTYGGCSSSSGMDSLTENRPFDLSTEVKAEPPHPLIHDLNEVPVESSPLSSGPSSSFPSLAGRSVELGSDATGERGIGLDLTIASFEAVCIGSGEQDNVRPTGRVYPNQNLGEDTISDAQVRRKRRREITRLKGIDRRH